MSGVAHSSYSGRGILCNAYIADALDRLLGEALAGEVAGRSRPAPAVGDDAPGTDGLGVERGQRRLDVLGSDATGLEVMLDQQVAGTAPCEELGAALCQAFVVDRAGTHQSLDGFLPHGSRHIPTRESFGELPLGQVAVLERARGPSQRLVLPELVP
jgi:hypothetical protein